MLVTFERDASDLTYEFSGGPHCFLRGFASSGRVFDRRLKRPARDVKGRFAAFRERVAWGGDL
jgi:hypothetical protein